MKYTEEQKHRALVKLAKAYGKWNTIEKDDAKTRRTRERKMYEAAFKVIQKHGVLNDYFLATGDIRGKKRSK